MYWLTKFLILFSAIAVNANCACNSTIDGSLIYEELACKSVLGSNNCTTSYNCSNLKAPKKGCLFHGTVYKDGQAINDAHPCKICYCNGTNIVCDPPFCWRLGPGPVLPGNCYHVIELNRCCLITRCPPYKHTNICVVNNVPHLEGQSFHPINTCLECVCQTGFDNKLVAPFCRKMRCDVQITYKKEIENSCAPLYDINSNKLCCPRNFVCQSGSKIQNLVRSKKETGTKCKFGSKWFNKNDAFTLVYKNDGKKRTANCVCSLPPFLTCKGKI